MNRLDVRRATLCLVRELELAGHEVAPVEIRALRQCIEDLPREMPDPVRVGDRVTFSWASGQQITIDGERYLILRASDVLAVLEA